MTTEFESGTTLNATDGSTIRIEKCLGRGGKGTVYHATYHDQPCALMWVDAIYVEEQFYQRVARCVRQGSPGDAFVWPLAMTPLDNKGFGYVIERLGDDARMLDEFTDDMQRFRPLEEGKIVSVCLQLAAAFDALHAYGCHFLSVAPHEGVMVSDPPIDGQCDVPRVRIVFGQHIAFDDEVTQYCPYMRYAAPELVWPTKNNATQSPLTDCWSLAEILFATLMLGHPLEGAKYLEMSRATTYDPEPIYGSGATFVVDRDDTSNRPDPVRGRAMIALWDCMPTHIKEVFWRAFGPEARDHPERRPTEDDWAAELALLSCEIVRCTKCGCEMYLNDDGEGTCYRCGEPWRASRWLDFGVHTVPASPGMRIYRAHVERRAARDALTEVGLVGEATQGLFFLNTSGTTLDAVTSTGAARCIESGKGAPLLPGIQVHAFSGGFVVQ